jgi:hypothetical protein
MCWGLGERTCPSCVGAGQIPHHWPAQRQAVASGGQQVTRPSFTGTRTIPALCETSAVNGPGTPQPSESLSTTTNWTKVAELHRDGGQPACEHQAHSYTYRCYPPHASAYEQCVAISWCSNCLNYSSAVVYVPVDQSLDDPVAALRPHERNDLRASERRLVERLDRMIGGGEWTPAVRSQ